MASTPGPASAGAGGDGTPGTNVLAVDPDADQEVVEKLEGELKKAQDLLEARRAKEESEKAKVESVLANQDQELEQLQRLMQRLESGEDVDFEEIERLEALVGATPEGLHLDAEETGDAHDLDLRDSSHFVREREQLLASTVQVYAAAAVRLQCVARRRKARKQVEARRQEIAQQQQQQNAKQSEARRSAAALFVERASDQGLQQAVTAIAEKRTQDVEEKQDDVADNADDDDDPMRTAYNSLRENSRRDHKVGVEELMTWDELSAQVEADLLTEKRCRDLATTVAENSPDDLSFEEFERFVQLVESAIAEGEEEGDDAVSELPDAGRMPHRPSAFAGRNPIFRAASQNEPVESEMREAYNTLHANSARDHKVGVEELMAWDDLSAEVEAGLLSEERCRQLASMAAEQSPDDLSFEEFERFVQLVEGVIAKAEKEDPAAAEKRRESATAAVDFGTNVYGPGEPKAAATREAKQVKGSGTKSGKEEDTDGEEEGDDVVSDLPDAAAGKPRDDAGRMPHRPSAFAGRNPIFRAASQNEPVESEMREAYKTLRANSARDHKVGVEELMAWDDLSAEVEAGLLTEERCRQLASMAAEQSPDDLSFEEFERFVQLVEGVIAKKEGVDLLQRQQSASDAVAFGTNVYTSQHSRGEMKRMGSTFAGKNPLFRSASVSQSMDEDIRGVYDRLKESSPRKKVGVDEIMNWEDLSAEVETGLLTQARCKQFAAAVAQGSPDDLSAEEFARFVQMVDMAIAEKEPLQRAQTADDDFDFLDAGVGDANADVVVGVNTMAPRERGPTLAEKHAAATRLQCLTRSRAAQNEVQSRRLSLAATTVLQRAVRCFVARRKVSKRRTEVAELRARMLSATLLMQRLARGFMARRVAEGRAAERLRVIMASMKLQSIVRAFVARRRARRLRVEKAQREKEARELFAAGVIQGATRGLIARRRVNEARQERNALGVLQNAVRVLLARRHVAQARREHQSSLRLSRFMRLAGTVVQRRRLNAVLRIQTSIRAKMARRRVDKLRQDQGDVVLQVYVELTTTDESGYGLLAFATLMESPAIQAMLQNGTVSETMLRSAFMECDNDWDGFLDVTAFRKFVDVVDKQSKLMQSTVPTATVTDSELAGYVGLTPSLRHRMNQVGTNTDFKSQLAFGVLQPHLSGSGSALARFNVDPCAGVYNLKAAYARLREQNALILDQQAAFARAGSVFIASTIQRVLVPAVHRLLTHAFSKWLRALLHGYNPEEPFRAVQPQILLGPGDNANSSGGSGNGYEDDPAAVAVASSEAGEAGEAATESSSYAAILSATAQSIAERETNFFVGLDIMAKMVGTARQAAQSLQKGWASMLDSGAGAAAAAAASGHYEQHGRFPAEGENSLVEDEEAEEALFLGPPRRDDLPETEEEQLARELGVAARKLQRVRLAKLTAQHVALEDSVRDHEMAMNQLRTELRKPPGSFRRNREDLVKLGAGVDVLARALRRWHCHRMSHAWFQWTGGLVATAMAPRTEEFFASLKGAEWGNEFLPLEQPEEAVVDDQQLGDLEAAQHFAGSEDTGSESDEELPVLNTSVEQTMWNASTLKCVCRLSEHTGVVNSVLIDSATDDTLFTCADDGCLKVWERQENEEDWECVQTIIAHHGEPVRKLALSEDGFTLVSGGNDGGLAVWTCDPALAYDQGDSHYHQQQLAQGAVADVNESMAHSTGGALHMNPDDGNEWKPWYSLAGHDGAVRALLVHNGRVYSSASDESVRVWDIATGTLVTVFALPGCDITCLFAKGRALVGGATDGRVYVWEIDTWSLKFHLQAHKEAVTNLLSVGSRLFTAGMDKSLQVWNIAAKECVQTLCGHTGVVTSLARAGSYIFSGGVDFSIIPWSMHTLHSEVGLIGHFEAVTTLDGSANMLVSGSADGSVVVWEPEEEMGLADDDILAEPEDAISSANRRRQTRRIRARFHEVRSPSPDPLDKALDVVADLWDTLVT